MAGIEELMEVAPKPPDLHSTHNSPFPLNLDTGGSFRTYTKVRMCFCACLVAPCHCIHLTAVEQLHADPYHQGILILMAPFGVFVHAMCFSCETCPTQFFSRMK
jgi:hypothetical protein